LECLIEPSLKRVASDILLEDNDFKIAMVGRSITYASEQQSESFIDVNYL